MHSLAGDLRHCNALTKVPFSMHWTLELLNGTNRSRRLPGPDLLQALTLQAVGLLVRTL